MGNMSSAYTSRKKVRGARRKSKMMIQNIQRLTEEFPEIDLDDGYWHMHLPVSQQLIDSSQTPSSVRGLCMQTLIDRAKFLSHIKPKLDISIRVVVYISLPRLWDSQIIIFFGDDYFEEFFDRDSEYQKWTSIQGKGNIAGQWNLYIPDNFRIQGFKEEIVDEDYQSSGELWFIGEID